MHTKYKLASVVKNIAALLLVFTAISTVYNWKQFTKEENSKLVDGGDENEKTTVTYQVVVVYLDTELRERQQHLNPRALCNCSNRILLTEKTSELKSETVQSTCSDEATFLGPSQKVLSFSLYLKGDYSREAYERYFLGVAANLALASRLYPGWVTRIYSDLALHPTNDMCSIICSHANMYFCDVSRLPELGDVRTFHPMTWRFLLLGDATVEQFAVRDADSRISKRERDAVREWEASTFPFHSMRDNPEHTTYILGGMWGANNYKLGLKTAVKLRHQIVKMNKGWFMRWFWNLNDQNILTSVIYKRHKELILTHDSYLCKIYRDSLPFPTRREISTAFIGQPHFTPAENSSSELKSLPHCPLECRPVAHKDWERC